jgi:hypothetical protein
MRSGCVTMRTQQAVGQWLVDLISFRLLGVG